MGQQLRRRVKKKARLRRIKRLKAKTNVAKAKVAAKKSPAAT